MKGDNDRAAEVIRELAAEFFARESNRTSLITITRATISNDGKKASVFATVMPESMERAAIGFFKRQRGPLRKFLIDRMGGRRVPFIEIDIDAGEKNRQKIDELLQN